MNMLGKLSLESIPHDPIVLTTLVGATVGGWSGALDGSSVPSEVRRDYEQEIAAGQLLVVIDEEDEALLERASDAVAAAGRLADPVGVEHRRACHRGVAESIGHIAQHVELAAGAERLQLDKPARAVAALMRRR